MYKKKGYRKLGRTSSHRKALLRNQASDLIARGYIVTTVEKAKEVRKVAEKMITLGKKGDLASRRKAASYIRNVTIEERNIGQKDELAARRKAPDYKGNLSLEDKTLLQYLFDDVATRYAERNGGYTRIIKLGTRRGDNAELAKIELV